ncbi:hypothetical protein GcM1_162011 [Golovinomyces cichoracearum]|uniref:Uncharacterized protein n=1 Tax=Golovinomyces cichoracearum TaxID=62708 RepID=A0A420J8Y3_9PEZI|nr:hypothetical protein GcM1_162011 [Golovinomyces cichoracearum]
MPSFGEKKIAEMIEKGDNAMEFNLREAVQQYLAWASFSPPSMAPPVQGAFATLDGMKQDPAGVGSMCATNINSSKPQNDKKRERRTPKCSCSEKQIFSEYQYVNSTLQKPGLIENTDISKKIRN